MRPLLVKCPTCGRQSPWSAHSPFRPFCSERCRLIDLGAWLGGERSIPGDAADPDAPPPEDETPSRNGPKPD